MTKTRHADDLQELAEVLQEIHKELTSNPNGYFKPVLTIVNSNFNPIYTVIVTDRF